MKSRPGLKYFENCKIIKDFKNFYSLKKNSIWIFAPKNLVNKEKNSINISQKTTKIGQNRSIKSDQFRSILWNNLGRFSPIWVDYGRFWSIFGRYIFFTHFKTTFFEQKIGFSNSVILDLQCCKMNTVLFDH